MSSVERTSAQAHGRTLRSRSGAFVRLCAGGLAVCASQAVAQRRPASEPEGNVMAYYAAVMTFSPVGLTAPGGRWELGGALSFIPSLPDEDRAVGFGGTKYENTNMCPVFPRLTAARRFGAIGVEAGWTPPLEVCGVKANIVAGAIGWRSRDAGWGMLLRGSVLAGSLEAAITCGEDAVANPADQTCFGGSVSEDKVSPLSLGIEAGVARGAGARAIEPYLLAGVSRHRVDFDVNYERTTDPVIIDHERFGTTRTRVHVAAGAAWQAASALRLGGEIYAAPGSLITLRARAAFTFGGSRAP